jgi:hypothetical protein
MAAKVLENRARSYRWDMEDDLVPESRMEEFTRKAEALEVVAQHLFSEVAK